MKSICISCNYIGESEDVAKCDHLTIALYFLIGALFVPFGFYYPILFIGTYFFIMKAIIGISCCYEYMSKCPKCNMNNFLPTSFFEQYDLLNNHHSNNKFSNDALDYNKVVSFLKFKQLKVCTFCDYIGLTRGQQDFSLIVGVLTFISGIFLIPFAYSSSLLLIGSYIFIVLGLLAIFANIRDSKKCPKCENKSLIPIDSKVAKPILEKKGIKYNPVDRPFSIPKLEYHFAIKLFFILITIITYIYYRLFLYFNSLN